MASLVGQSFPEDVTFTYIPYIPDKGGLNQVCGMPVAYKASDEFKDKKVVIVAVPGAFTPTCSEQHLPTFLEQKAAFQQAGVDKIIVLASNDPFVMSAWGKANGVTDDYILFMSDTDTKFSSQIGWAKDGRTARYAMIVDHGKVTYAADQPTRGSVDAVDAPSVLAKL